MLLKDTSRVWRLRYYSISVGTSDYVLVEAWAEVEVEYMTKLTAGIRLGRSQKPQSFCANSRSASIASNSSREPIGISQVSVVGALAPSLVSNAGTRVDCMRVGAGVSVGSLKALGPWLIEEVVDEMAVIAVEVVVLVAVGEGYVNAGHWALSNGYRGIEIEMDGETHMQDDPLSGP
ncbi:hypothetical protein BCR41DRAFT_374173 [Lobosporangium transversale]|uniref:Uncharacterized protein n=1 Tax=Lobosporangium transversale TaxID=64571 RepID=A0A1Y2GFE7_9FUNG|nr:hypothetical protein BCR41DRAFT_374173 [Lobosporangium transversale]ORZ06142.1 hypothetical protein BCR41DRAFT_374173 [Lobosporangium transversale]|eukprot:XP_021877411.1 hypothetical protein BCR41DRAFT_374173 [Lobosporangium transversale]